MSHGLATPTGKYPTVHTQINETSNRCDLLFRMKSINGKSINEKKHLKALRHLL